MEKVIAINLNGNAYQLDESGYNLLAAYLDRADSQLKDNPDKAEVLTDLEQAIAEKCNAFLGPHKTVVSAAEIGRIINEMGPVDGAAGEPSSARPEDAVAGTDGAKTDAGAPKRLYQIREGAMISGVCKGLAAYFNIDVTIVRLIFVVLAVLTYGAWIGAYVVMMFVIPYAHTSEERAAAFGLPFSAQDLIDQAKQNYAGFKQSKQWKRHWKQHRRQWKEWRRTVKEQARSWEPPVPEYAGYAAQVLTGILTSLFALITVAFFALMVLAIISLVKTGAIWGWMLPAGIPLWAGIVGVVVLFHVITSPLQAAHHSGHYWMRHGYGPGHTFWAAWGGVLWLALITFGVWYGYHHVPQVHDFIESLPAVWYHIRHSLK